MSAGVATAAICALVALSLVRGPDVALRPLECSRLDTGWCRGVTGRVMALERRDGDGDGDVHLVLLSKDSVSGPGLSIVKLSRSRGRWAVPRFGDWVSAIGFPDFGGRGLVEIDARAIRSG